MTTPRDDIAGLSERLRKRSEPSEYSTGDVLGEEAATQLDSLLKEREALGERVKELEENITEIPQLLRKANARALRAEQERDEAVADSARLDFLDQMNSRLNAHYGTTYKWELILNHNVNRLMLNHLSVDLNDAKAHGLKSCRDAIDAEMKRLGFSCDLVRRLSAGPEKIAAANDGEDSAPAGTEG